MICEVLFQASEFYDQIEWVNNFAHQKSLHVQIFYFSGIIVDCVNLKFDIFECITSSKQVVWVFTRLDNLVDFVKLNFGFVPGLVGSSLGLTYKPRE